MAAPVQPNPGPDPKEQTNSPPLPSPAAAAVLSMVEKAVASGTLTTADVLAIAKSVQALPGKLRPPPAAPSPPVSSHNKRLNLNKCRISKRCDPKRNGFCRSV